LAFFQTVSVAVIAATGAVIAWLQMRIAGRKLKLDLFDRRYAVFCSTRNLLRAALMKGDVPPENLEPFSVAIGPTAFLFKAEIEQYHEALRHRVVQLHADKMALDHQAPLPQSEINRLTDKHLVDMDWLAKQFDHIIKLYGKYLNLKSIV